MFLHCVPTANAYLRMLMNCVFGNKNFRNKIVWSYKRWSTKMIRAFPRLHDTILFYAKSKGNHKFNTDAVRVPFSKPLVKRGKTWKSDDEATLKERTATDCKRGDCRGLAGRYSAVELNGKRANWQSLQRGGACFTKFFRFAGLVCLYGLWQRNGTGVWEWNALGNLLEVETVYDIGKRIFSSVVIVWFLF